MRLGDSKGAQEEEKEVMTKTNYYLKSYLTKRLSWKKYESTSSEYKTSHFEIEVEYFFLNNLMFHVKIFL